MPTGIAQWWQQKGATRSDAHWKNGPRLSLSTEVFRCSERKRKYNQFNKMAQFMAKLFHFDSFSFNFWPIPWTLAVHFVRNALPHSPYILVRAAIMVTAPHLDPFDRNPWLISGMRHERGGSQRFPNGWERNATFRFLITSSMIWVLKVFFYRECIARHGNEILKNFSPTHYPDLLTNTSSWNICWNAEGTSVSNIKGY